MKVKSDAHYFLDVSGIFIVTINPCIGAILIDLLTASFLL